LIGLALSGGGSRAIAFHLGCLRALNDLCILPHIDVLSTISGGSVIGALYAYSPTLSFDEFDALAVGILRQGFHRRIGLEMIKPVNVARVIGSTVAALGASALQQVGVSTRVVHREPNRTDMFCSVLDREVFPTLRMSSPRRGDLRTVIGACDLRTGTAFRFGDKASGSWRLGKLKNWDVPLSFAVGASAAYPVLLPALDRTWEFRKGDSDCAHRVLLTDGGVYDNLGVQVLEPGRDATYSLINYPCEYLIVCSAGHGQDIGNSLPVRALSRVSHSFGIVHRRVQDSAIARLHRSQVHGSIRGFALPYLGQQDSALPWMPEPFVRRGEVVGYPTNFAPMTDDWIQKLAGRGEALTRMLVSVYLPDLFR
jgi:NTE family protein